jgi:glucokinase
MGGTDWQVIGIDLGGTAIKLGRFTTSGVCLQELTISTPQPATPAVVANAMAQAVAVIDPHHEAKAIGLGTPGPADAAGRVARVAINLKGWRDVPIADWLEEKTGLPTVVANDANCAGLGEAWLGAGRSYQDVIMLTLGTGVGGAIILNGKVFVGRRGTAGELGLITLNPAGHPCNSGNRGSLEQHCSVQAIRRETGLSPAELAEKARGGDGDAISYWQTYGRNLGCGLASLVYVLTPEAIILGGGISAAADLFLPATLAELKTRVLPSSWEDCHIVLAELGNRAGMAGAAKLALQTFANDSAPQD